MASDIAPALTFDERRRQNIIDNKRVLFELGLSNPFKPLKVIQKATHRKRRRDDDDSGSATKKARKAFVAAEVDEASLTPGSRRRSSRLQGKDAGSEPDLPDETDSGEGTPSITRVAANRPNVYGVIPGVDVGTHWFTRMECCHDGVHRPPVAGIHGHEQEGAYSLALSGGYEDDIDLGDCFTYTGEGGRDLKGTKNNPKNLRTAAQSKDQDLTRGNLALSRNVATGNPVRVIRGYKLDSQFAPEEGYRYDGLYTVEKFWNTSGLSGYGVWKFALRRCDGQAAPPWNIIQEIMFNNANFESTYNSTGWKFAFRRCDGQCPPPWSIIQNGSQESDEKSEQTQEVDPKDEENDKNIDNEKLEKKQELDTEDKENIQHDGNVDSEKSDIQSKDPETA